MNRLALATAIVVFWISSANASSIKVVEIGQDVELDIRTYPGHAVTIDVDEPATLAVLGNKRDYWLEKGDLTHYVLQTKTKHAPQTNVNVDSWGGNAVIRIRAAETPDEATLHIRFVHPQDDTMDLADARDPDHARSIHHRTLANYAMQTTMVLANDIKTWEEGLHRLELHTGYVTQGEAISVFPFTLSNRGYDYPITRFELRDHMGQTIIGSFHTPMESDFNSNSVLGRGKSIRGAFVFETPVKLDQGWQLHLSTTDGLTKAAFSHDSLPTFEPGMLELRTMFSVHGLGGAINLSDNVGLGQTTWGAIRGAGVQLHYGPSKHTALVAGLDFVSASSATIDMSPGQLETSATGGRLHIGGRLHTGDKFVPYTQVGLGVMMASHRFETNGVRDSEFRAALLGSLGVGVEMWIADRYVVGLGFTASAPLGGNTGFAIEGGLRVGLAFGKLRDSWTYGRVLRFK